MLLNTVILPTALGQLPEDEHLRRAHCNAAIGLLRDVAANCLLLVDRDGAIESDYRRAVEGYPPKFQPQVKELFKHLYKTKRIVKFPREHRPYVTCIAGSCVAGVGIAASTHCILFSNDECQVCILHQAAPVKAISVQDYQTSEFNEERREAAKGYTVADRQWTQRELEQNVLRPVFAHAKHVKVIDRYIGRATMNNGRIKEGYLLALDMLLKVFMDSPVQSAERSFKVYCGLLTMGNYDPQAASAATALSALRAYEKAKRAAGVPLSIIIKREAPGLEMPHARYLFTDQVSLLIERGFDLFWTDRKMRAAGLNPRRDARPVKDLTITHCPEPWRVEESVRSLPNL